MNFLALTLEQMVAVSGDWLSNQKTTLEKLSYTTCYLEELEDSHKHLIAFLPKPLEVPEELQSLIELGVSLDKRYDRLYRACNRVIEAQALFADSEDDEERWLSLQRYYFPRGDAGVALTFQEESGAALILNEKLHTEDALALGYQQMSAQVSATKESTLLEVLQLLAFVGKELGEIDTAKTKGLKELEESHRANAGDNARRMQFEWIELAKLIVGGVARGFKKGLLSKEEHDTLLDPLEKANNAAQRRLLAKQKTESKPKPE